MKNPKTMTFKALEQEVSSIRNEMATATTERKRVLIRRSHELLVEIDHRWNVKEGKTK